MMNNSSAIAEFKKQADKLIEEEVHEHYNKSPGNVSLGRKYWPDVWKRLQSLNSKVQIFDHPMKYQPVLDHLWQKYAELVEQTNAILLPHGEQAKEIIAEAEDSDEEPDAVVNSAVQPLAQKQSSGWSKHVGHAASAKYGNLDAAKPVLPTHQKQQETPEMNVARPVEKVVKSSKKEAKIETFDSMPPMPPMPSLPASIPMSGNSNGLPSNLNYAEMLDKMHKDQAFKGEKQGMAKIRVSTEDLAPFILSSKEYYEKTNDEDMLDELLNLIERDGDCTEVTIEGWMADLYIDFKNNGFKSLHVEKFEKQRQREKFQAQVGMVDVEFEKGVAIGGDIDFTSVGDLMKAAATGGVKGIDKVKNKKKKVDSGMDDDGGAGRGEEDLDFNLGDDSDDENEENRLDDQKNSGDTKNISILQNEDGNNQENQDPRNLGILDGGSEDEDEAEKYLGQADAEDDPMLTAEDMLIKKNLIANLRLRKEQKDKGIAKEKMSKAPRTSKQIKDEMGMLTNMFSSNLYDTKENAERQQKEQKKEDRRKAKLAKRSQKPEPRKPSDDTDILLPPPANVVNSHLMPFGMPLLGLPNPDTNKVMSDDDEGVLLAPTMNADSTGLKIQQQLNRKRAHSGAQMDTDEKLSPTKKLKLADKPIYKSPGQLKSEEKNLKKMRKEAKRMKKAKKQAKRDIAELANLKPGSLLKMGSKIESASAGPSKKKKVNAWLDAQADKKRSIKAIIKEGAKNMSLKGGEFEVEENLGHKSWDKFNDKERKEALVIGQSARLEDMLKSKERSRFMLQKMQEIEKRVLPSYEDVAF